MTAVVPVVLFAYCRPDLLERTLDCLRENRVPKIYAFSDAPATAGLADGVAAVRRVLRNVDWCDLTLCERPTNLGLGRSILAGVTDVLARHESVIVFEDDLT
jgi:hypothetical protein